jgi:hypothetical protein
MLSMRTSLLPVACLLIAILATPAAAVDDPALPDGGALAVITDGGTVGVFDTGTSGSWNAAIRCDPGAYYRFCRRNDPATSDPGDGGSEATGQGTCVPTVAHSLLDPQRTFDLPIPPERRYLGLRFGSSTSSDGGQPTCGVYRVTL